jgi:predicted site-specific integrase-resolvase
MSNIELLKPREVDVLLRYPPGRTAKLARAGRIPCIRLPDGEIRIDADEIKRLLATAADGEKAHA